MSFLTDTFHKVTSVNIHNDIDNNSNINDNGDNFSGRQKDSHAQLRKGY